jgi:hypothetical protein
MRDLALVVHARVISTQFSKNQNDWNARMMIKWSSTWSFSRIKGTSSQSF